MNHLVYAKINNDEVIKFSVENCNCPEQARQKVHAVLTEENADITRIFVLVPDNLNKP